MMRILQITPPEPVVTVQEAKQQIRVFHDQEDALIGTYVAAAQTHIDGPDGWLGRAVGRQTLEARGALFRTDPIRLRYPPVVTVESVMYEDDAGVWQTLDAAAYELRGDEIGTSWGAVWPTTRAYRGAAETVRIRYEAGYDAVPAPITMAIMLMAADLYANRETVGIGAYAAIPMSLTVERLLAPYRVFS